MYILHTLYYDVCLYVYTAGSLDAMKDLVAESAIMKTFHHPNVLPLLGVCIDYDDEDILKIVMPFMANGDLKTFLKDSRVSPNNTHEYPKVCNMLLKDCMYAFSLINARRYVQNCLTYIQKYLCICYTT